MLNNIGVALVKSGNFVDALSTFEECLEANGDYATALNLTITAYLLDDSEKMREAFQRLVDIPPMTDDETKHVDEPDILLAQVRCRSRIAETGRSFFRFLTTTT